MPSLMTTTDLEIAYTPRRSDMVYDIHLCGAWVASATTFHTADLVSQEVQYRTFLSSTDPIDDEPGDDCEDHGPYADDDCPKCPDD